MTGAQRAEMRTEKIREVQGSGGWRNRKVQSGKGICVMPGRAVRTSVESL